MKNRIGVFALGLLLALGGLYVFSSVKGQTQCCIPPHLPGPTPNGRSVLYVEGRAGVSNIWSQPIDGSPPKQLTNFKSDLIFGYDLS